MDSTDQSSDSLQQSPSISSSISSNSYKDFAIDVLNKAVVKGNSIAESNPGSKRAIAISTASTIVEMSLEKYSSSNLSSRRSGRSGSIELTDEQISQIDGDGNKRKSGHFADRMIEKLLKSVLPQDIPEREIFEKRLNDPERNKRPGLSLGVLTSNVKQMAGKMTNFFALQYEVLYIIAWKKPTKTISALVLYTAVCLWPHLVLAYPLIFVLFSVLIPGYVHRHPQRNPELIKVKKRGQSLLSFLFETPETSIRESDEMASSTYSISEETSEVTVSSLMPLDSESPKKDDVAKHRKSQIALLINLRDFQNLTTDILKGINNAEKFYYETGGFKDERLSTFIFYGVLLSTFGILFVGKYVPWRLIFIQGGWTGAILCHPNCKKFLVEASKARKARAAIEKAKKEEESVPEIIIKDANDTITQFDRNDIIVDDSPETRIVEIYELQIKSILKHSWAFYRYSTTIYDKNNKARIAGKRPPGVDHLSKVYPPNDWKFDFGLVNKWNLDTEPNEFIRERSLNPNLFIVKNNESQGWIYDNMEGVVHLDIVYEFRRRRLYRECYRYGRPHKQPSKY